MDFAPSPRAAELTDRVRTFIAEEIEPAEPAYHRAVAERRVSGGDPWQPLPLLDELRAKARERGLWNLFLPAGGLSDDFPLAAAWTGARSLRLADGPDEVHRGVVAKLELAKYVAGGSR